jgi:hypothetical protein
MTKKKELTSAEVATMGGRATLAKYGTAHFSKLAQARWSGKGRSKQKQTRKK